MHVSGERALLAKKRTSAKDLRWVGEWWRGVGGALWCWRSSRREGQRGGSGGEGLSRLAGNSKELALEVYYESLPSGHLQFSRTDIYYTRDKLQL